LERRARVGRRRERKALVQDTAGVDAPFCLPDGCELLRFFPATMKQASERRRGLPRCDLPHHPSERTVAGLLEEGVKDDQKWHLVSISCELLGHIEGD